MNEDLLHLWLGMFPNMLNGVRKKIVDYYGGVKGLWEADADDLREHLMETQAETILSSRKEEFVIDYRKKLDARGITYVYPGHPHFPKKLLSIPDCPQLLYAKGRVEDLASDRIGIAIVGARKASAYGKNIARQFATDLAGRHITIISGLAAGIDGAAQGATISVPGGSTIAVLGCGINICYPRENYALFEKIERQGVILSEYGLDVPPERWRFPPRNRIISGLANGVLVVEAMEKSGSLITADQALEQGRDVFAIPGRIGDANSEGCNRLIRQGAELVLSPDDIIESLGMETDGQLSFFSDAREKLSEIEQHLLSLVSTQPMHIEDICRHMGLSAQGCLSLLYDMERRGLICQPIRHYYARK